MTENLVRKRKSRLGKSTYLGEYVHKMAKRTTSSTWTTSEQNIRQR